MDWANKCNCIFSCRHCVYTPSLLVAQPPRPVRGQAAHDVQEVGRQPGQDLGATGG